MLRIALSVLLLGGALAAFAAEPPALLNLSAGNLRFSLNKQTGMALSLRGVPVIRRSGLYIMKPGWSAAYLNQDVMEPDVEFSEEGGAKIGTATLDTPDAYARYRFEVRPDDTFKVTLTFGSRGPRAVVEHIAGYLNANILQGAKFTAQTVKGKVSGVVPLFAETSDQEASRLTPNFSHIKLDTVLGPMEMTVEGTSGLTKSLTLFDSRAGTARWSRENPMFWLGIGVPAPPLEPGEHTLTVTYKFGKPGPRAKALPALGTPKPVALKEAQLPHVPDLPVIPRPKGIKPGKSPFRVIPGKTVIVISTNATEEEKQAARELQAEFREFWGTTVRIEARGIPKPDGDPGPSSIILATKQQLREAFTAEEMATAESDPLFAKIDKHAEGYGLVVDGDAVGLVGADPRGAYYGVQTLKQLIRVDAKGVYIKPVEINDWPSLSFRGVHWYGGPDAFSFHKKMIDRIISAYKMNAMVFQCDYTQWASQPKIWSAERSSPKADVKKAVDYARAHFIEPIPLVNTLGHSEWLFWNKQNLDICADPSKPYAYDPENPRTYEIVMPIMQEAVDLFQPKYFHIGHDEVTMTGKFPKEGSTKTTTELILADTNKIYDWLTAKGIKTMMWGDMLLHESEATDAGLAPTKADAVARRAGVPKDIIIADWHYQGSDPEFPSVSLLQKEGHRVIGTTWYDWGNIQNFSRVLNKENSMGYLQSTWAGYNMFPDIVKGESFNQFVAYLLGAEYAWNGGKPNVADLGYSPDDAFLAAWNRRPVSMAKRPGFAVDLSPASNAAMWEWIPGKSAKKPAKRAAAFPTSKIALGGVIFKPSLPVWLAGSLDASGSRPKSVTMSLNGRKAGDLHFLWGTTFSALKDTRVATLKVAYADSSMVEVPIAYGRQIFAFTDAQAGPQTTTAWKGKTSYGEPAGVRRFMWTNPHPAKPIKSVTLISAGTEAAPVLLGVTGVQ